MTKRTFFTASVLIVLSACANNPPLATPGQLAHADYGSYPDNYQQIMKDYYSDSLFDPYTARFRFPGKPYKAYSRTAPIAGGVPDKFGYVVTACVNAKNKFGGYVGEQCHKFLIRNGVVVEEFMNMSPFFKEQWYQ